MKRYRIFKRIIIWSLVSIFALVLLVAGAIAYTLNFIFTPEKLTPLIVRVANENLDARLSLRSVELKFFSTFPNFSLAIDSGALMSKSMDTTLMTDTIVSFDRVNIVVDPMALIRNEQVVVHRIALDRPRIYAAVRSDGVPNWLVYKNDTASVDTASADSVTGTSLRLTLSDIRINNGDMTFDDRQSELYSVLRGLSMNLDGDLSAAGADVALGFSFTDGLLWQRGELLFSGIDFSTMASVAIDTLSKRLIVRQSQMDINNIKFMVDGDITPDTVNMKLSLVAPSLATVLDILPLRNSAAKLTSTGSVDFSGDIRGAYKNGSVPVVNARIVIDGATAHYQGLKYGIDGLSLRADAHLDMSCRSDSYVNIDKFAFKGASTAIDFRGLVSGLLSGNPKFSFVTKSSLDLTELAQTFPLEEGSVIEGVFTIDGAGEVSANQLRKADYGTITAAVKIAMKGVKLSVKDKIDAGFDGMAIAASNNNDGLLMINGSARELRFNSKDINSSLSEVDFNLQGVKSRVDTLPSYIKGGVGYASLRASTVGDSVKIFSGRSSVDVELSKRLGVVLATDSLLLRILDNTFVMRAAKVDGWIDRDKRFAGTIGFGGIRVNTPSFPLPMSMPATVVTVSNSDVILKKASFKVGRSDLLITGAVKDMIAASLGKAPLRMKVDMSSSNLDLTQIFHTLNSLERSDNTTSVATSLSNGSAADSSTIKPFRIPRNIDFDLNTQFDKVEFGDLKLESLRGIVSLKDGVARLNDLSFMTLGAELGATMVYDSHSSDSISVGLILGSRSIDVHSVIELMPTLDTLLPMMNSFEGKIDFSVAADTRLSRDFRLNPKDIRAVAQFSGEDLVLLDGQTFAEISKMLMFKNKQRNVVDSVSVELAVNDGAVEVFPFVIQLDRYRAAVGGEHLFNNNFNYHISVLKSPIPFKFGINITGSVDDMKVGIGKTKYKFMNDPTTVKQISPKFIDIRKEITDAIRKL